MKLTQEQLNKAFNSLPEATHTAPREYMLHVPDGGIPPLLSSNPSASPREKEHSFQGIAFHPNKGQGPNEWILLRLGTMKKLILITALFLPLVAAGQIEPSASLELGHSSKVVRLFDSYDDPQIDKEGQYVSIYLGAKYKRFELMTTTSTYMQYNGEAGFSPWLSVYDIELSYKTKKIEAGFSHTCSHFAQSNKSYTFTYSNVEDKFFLKFNLIR